MALNRKGLLRFSIIIPTHNRAEILLKTLIRLVNLNYKSNNYEVLVVDNISNDDTKIVVNEFISTHKDFNIKYLFGKKLGPSYARNTGAKRALYRHIVFLDDDILIDKNILNKYNEVCLMYPNSSVVFGKCSVFANDGRLLKHYLDLLDNDSWVFSLINRKEKSNAFLKFPDDFISSNVCINLNTVRGKIFDTNFGKKYSGGLYIGAEDTELSLRLLNANHLVVYAPSITSKHLVLSEKLKFRYILQRFFRAGVENQLIDQKYKNIGYQSYKFDWRLLINLIKTYVKKPSKKNILNVVREILFLAGYYFPISWL